MFATVGRTWEIIKICWGVLQKDRELLLFPLYSSVAMMILIAITFTSSQSTGTFEKLTAESGENLPSADVAFLAIIYFAASFIVFISTLP